MDAKNLIWSWLQRSLSQDSLNWLGEKSSLLSGSPSDNDTFIAFSGAIRYSGKAPLELKEEDLKTSDSIQPGWQPLHWNLDDAARIYLLLSLNSEDKDNYAQMLDKLFQNSDMRESAALIKASAILPHHEIHYQRVREGARTNMKNVFESVSHYNPYPSLYFEEDPWNQMVLKSLFIESTLDPIVGLDNRANEKLMLMLVDYSRERRAANRTISPELWRCVGPLAAESQLPDLERALNIEDTLEQKGAALALHSCNLAGAKEILESSQGLSSAVKSGSLSWQNVFEFAL